MQPIFTIYDFKNESLYWCDCQTWTIVCIRTQNYSFNYLFINFTDFEECLLHLIEIIRSIATNTSTIIILITNNY